MTLRHLKRFIHYEPLPGRITFAPQQLIPTVFEKGHSPFWTSCFCRAGIVSNGKIFPFPGWATAGIMADHLQSCIFRDRNFPQPQNAAKNHHI
jgi:hypothetical protein